MNDLTRRMDDATAATRLLDHPFYKAWAAGTLSKEDLRFYSTQYWRQVEAFPGYLSALAERLPAGTAKDTILANHSDEVDGDHAGLWIAFAEGMGAPEAEVKSSSVEPETQACVANFQAGTESASEAFALGMLYGYESQTPAVAETKVAGLRSHYGVEGPALEYFELHGEMDVEHTRELADALATVAVDEDSQAQAVAGAQAGAEAIWGLLDGVARVRGIEAC